LPNDAQKQILMDSLTFAHIDTRQTTIKNAHADTCTWLLESKQYRDWMDANKICEHYGFLWIKGKPGTGKSTLMKFARANARRTMKAHIILSFYFNFRGDVMQRSTTGLYRSLLLQLLQHLPALRNIFDSLELSTSNIGPDHEWDIKSLEALLEQAIQSLEGSSVICFIDALDECGESQARDMVHFFERMSKLAVLNGIRFLVCYSSRHYPHITMHYGLELVLERQEGHAQDIASYVKTELNIGNSTTAQKVKNELEEKASGIFMWVVLVVNRLQFWWDRGQVQVWEKLQNSPNVLQNLYHEILTRNSHGKDEFVLCIQWVLFARQQLSPELLYYVILLGIEPEALTEWDPQEITQDMAERLVLDSSRGLTEVATSTERKVQLIHESVRDFLVTANGLSNVQPDYGSNFQGQSHDRLKDFCVNHINVDFNCPSKNLGDIPKFSTQHAASLHEFAARKSPFLQYAVRNVFYHAEMAEHSGISQKHFLDSFPLVQWIKLDNLFNKQNVCRHTERASLLYVLAELDMACLLRSLLAMNSCLQIEDERYGCPIFAAIATGSQRVIKVCLEVMGASLTVQDLSSKPYENDIEVEPKKHLSSRDFKYSKTRGIFSCAAELGHEALLAHLIKSGKYEIDSRDPRGRSPLWWASFKGHRAVMKLLLNVNIDVDNRDLNNETPLHVAAEQGHASAVQLLLGAGADVNNKNSNNKTPLHVAAEQGYANVVQLLLGAGADVNNKNSNNKTPLHVAAEQGYANVVQLLLGAGANYSTALRAASRNEHKRDVALLVDDSTDVEILQETKQLFDMGHTDIITASHEGSMPPMSAAENRHEPAIEARPRHDFVSEQLAEVRAKKILSDAYHAMTRSINDVQIGLSEEDHHLQDQSISQHVPPTDSGYVSWPTETMDNFPNANTDLDDTKTEYSEAVSVSVSTKSKYISELSDDLLAKVLTNLPDRQTIERLIEVLPEYLKALALRIGCDLQSQRHREIMVFIYKYRQ
jgi:ankyrin repeat protein